MSRWHPTPAFLPGKSHGWRSLVGRSPWGRWESDMTEWLHFHFHFSLSCTGEGNGNSLQCFCLENPRDGGAWWADIYGVAQSRTRLKRLCSSSSRENQVQVRSLGWILIHYDWCPGHRDTCRGRVMWRYAGKDEQSVSQGKRLGTAFLSQLLEGTNPTNPQFLIYSLQNYERMHFCCLRHPVCSNVLW